jgi:hypothetical protein
MPSRDPSFTSSVFGFLDTGKKPSIASTLYFFTVSILEIFRVECLDDLVRSETSVSSYTTTLSDHCPKVREISGFGGHKSFEDFDAQQNSLSFCSSGFRYWREKGVSVGGDSTSHQDVCLIVPSSRPTMLIFE